MKVCSWPKVAGSPGRQLRSDFNCPAMSSASFTSMPSYLTVLCSLMWLRSNWTALMFFILHSSFFDKLSGLGPTKS